MANSFTDLALDVQIAADVIGRELTGFIPSVTMNSGSERAAKDDTVRAFFTQTMTATDATPSMTIPEGTDRTVDNKTMTLNKFRTIKWNYTGEDTRHLDNGYGFRTIYGAQLLQAIRALANEVETDLGVALKNGACRAVGTAGTTPFASNHNVINQARKELMSNGCPIDDLNLVFDLEAGLNMRNLSNLYKVNEAGGDALFRQGVLQDISGVKIRESGFVASHTAGTGSGYLLNQTAGADVNDTSLILDTGTGTLVVGDVLYTGTGGTENYVVGTALTGSTVVINEPGLTAALANNVAINHRASYTGNSMFHRSAVELAMRAPALPAGGDAADEHIAYYDERTGLSFDVAVYRGYRKVMFDVSAVWGVKVWKPNHVVTLMG